MMVVICAGRAAIPAPIGHGFDLAALRARGQRELRRERCVEVVHQTFGVRGFAELLEELVRHRLVDEDEVDRRLLRYARPDDEGEP
jgi:hypothetical protein